MKRSSFYLPVFFFIITIILLSLPGNEFPKSAFFKIKGLDKVVHMGMFCVLTWLFCRPFNVPAFSNTQRKSWFLKIALYALLYGVIMEFVQKYLVPFRSFEMADILYDGFGAFAGFWLSTRTLLQKKPV